MTSVAIIPAKGHSRRIPHKNAKPFHGKPIIAYPIDAAQKCGYFTRVVVSTDDEHIARIAGSCGAEVHARKKALCGDEYGPHDVCARVLTDLEEPFDYACCIYATAALLAPYDLSRGFEVLSTSDFDYAVSVAADPAPLTDAAQFIWARAPSMILRLPLWTARTALVPIAPERVCDINTLDDWHKAERMFKDL